MSVGDSQERPSAARVAQTAPFESSHTTIAVPLPSTARSAAYSEPCPTDQVAIVVGRPQPVLGSKRMACMLVQGQKSGGGQWSQTTIACPWASMATIGEMSKASSPVAIAVGEPHPGPFTNRLAQMSERFPYSCTHTAIAFPWESAAILAPVAFPGTPVSRGTAAIHPELCAEACPAEPMSRAATVIATMAPNALKRESLVTYLRSEERRVGKECRCRWARCHSREQENSV